MAVIGTTTTMTEKYKLWVTPQGSEDFLNMIGWVLVLIREYTAPITVDGPFLHYSSNGHSGFTGESVWCYQGTSGGGVLCIRVR
jgi:hypothetical protein